MPVKSSSLRSLKPAKGTAIVPQVSSEMLQGLTSERGSKAGSNRVSTLTQAQREKRIRDKSRKRMIFDCTEDLAAAIALIMKKYEGRNKDPDDKRTPFPKSDLIELIMVLGLEKLLEKGGGIRELFVPTTSPHYEFKLDVPDAPDLSGLDADNDYPR